MTTVQGLRKDHDILTSNGWKPIRTVTLEDKCASLVNDCLRYVEPIQIHHWQYEGKIYNIKNQQIDLAVTEDSLLVTSKPFGRKKVWLKHELRNTNQVCERHLKYKKDATWNKSDYQFILPEYYDYPALKVDMHSWLIFFGIWIAEGFCTKNKQVGIAQNKQRVKDELHPALKKLGFKYTTYKKGTHIDNLNIYNKQLINYMAPLSVGSPKKYLPGWVWKLSSEQARTLIHGMWLGDGSKGNSSSIFYYTCSRRLADDFYRLCLHAGWSSNETIHIPAGTTNIIRGKEVTNHHNILRLGIIKTKNTPAVNHGHVKEQNVQKEQFYDFKGPVYNVTVPSGMIYVRRNGKPCWTGSAD